MRSGTGRGLEWLFEVPRISEHVATPCNMRGGMLSTPVVIKMWDFLFSSVAEPDQESLQK